MLLFHLALIVLYRNFLVSLYPAKTLADIEVAMKILRSVTTGETEHSIDRHYRQLDCGLQPIDHKSADFLVRIHAHAAVRAPAVIKVEDTHFEVIFFSWKASYKARGKHDSRVLIFFPFFFFFFFLCVCMMLLSLLRWSPSPFSACNRCPFSKVSFLFCCLHLLGVDDWEVCEADAWKNT